MWDKEKFDMRVKQMSDSKENKEEFNRIDSAGMSVLSMIEKESKPSWWVNICNYFKRTKKKEEPEFFNLCHELPEEETDEKEPTCDEIIEDKLNYEMIKSQLHKLWRDGKLTTKEYNIKLDKINGEE